MLGVPRGAKGGDLPLLMATDRKDDWAASDYRVWLCGHIHHYSANIQVITTQNKHPFIKRAPNKFWNFYFYTLAAIT